MSYVKEEKSLKELFSELSVEVREFFRKEFQLAKNEMTGKLSIGAKDVKSLAVGGAVLYAGFLSILAAVIFLLGTFLSLWFSALIVGLVVGGAGYYMVKKGLNEMKSLNLKPDETIESFKEDKKWLKERTT